MTSTCVQQTDKLAKRISTQHTAVTQRTYHSEIVSDFHCTTKNGGAVMAPKLLHVFIRVPHLVQVGVINDPCNVPFYWECQPLLLRKFPPMLDVKTLTCCYISSAREMLSKNSFQSLSWNFASLWCGRKSSSSISNNLI